MRVVMLRTEAGPYQRNRQVKRILVVEDDRATGEFLGDLLQDEGYAVSHAQNGREALELVDEVRPQLIISDVMMPELDGVEMWQRMRQGAVQHLPPVVFMSAVASPGWLAGAPVIEKPFDINVMLETVSDNLINAGAP